MRAACLLLILLLSSSALGQEVIDRTSGIGPLRRKGEKAAAKVNRKDWPLVNDGAFGTQVHITFDFDDADIIFLAYPPPEREAMLTEARRIAKAMGYEKADYLLYPVKTYFGLDIELNDYLPKGRSRSFAIDVDKLGKVLAQSQVLPKPILLRIDPEDTDQTAVTTGSGKRSILNQSEFLALHEIPEAAQVEFSAAVTWRAYAGAAVLLVLLLALIVKIVAIPWETASQIRQARKHAEGVVDPEERQRLYESTRWKFRLSGLGFVGLILIFTVGKDLLSQASRVIPEPNLEPRAMLLGVPAVFASLFAISWIAHRTYTRVRGEAPTPWPREDPRAQKVQGLAGTYLLVLMLPIPLMLGMMFIPAFTSLEPNIRRAVLFTPLIVCAPFGIALMVRETLRQRMGLKPGDYWYDVTQSIAHEAGVRVKNVVLVKEPMVNASASLLGTITLYEGLLDKLDEPEIRAIIAHEVGHIKARHVMPIFLMSLGLVGAWIVVMSFGRGYFEKNLSPSFAWLLTSPIVGMYVFPMFVALLLGGRRRRNEREADRFAVQITGDPEIVISALKKVHAENESPVRLDKIDEAFSSHPSLENRIKAIREGANS